MACVLLLLWQHSGWHVLAILQQLLLVKLVLLPAAAAC
jgi:hypothetical protein